jgi:hypothetical protein
MKTLSFCQSDKVADRTPTLIQIKPAPLKKPDCKTKRAYNHVEEPVYLPQI